MNLRFGVRAILGALGGLIPLMVLTATSHHRAIGTAIVEAFNLQTDPADLVGFLFKIVCLITLGAVVSVAIEPETRAFRCLMVGAAAPSLLATWIGAAGTTPAPAAIGTKPLQTGSSLFIREANAQRYVPSAGQCIETQSFIGRAYRGFIGRGPNQSAENIYIFSNPGYSADINQQKFTDLLRSTFSYQSEMLIVYPIARQARSDRGAVFVTPPSEMTLSLAGHIAEFFRTHRSSADVVDLPSGVRLVPYRQGQAIDFGAVGQRALFLVSESALQNFAERAALRTCD